MQTSIARSTSLLLMALLLLTQPVGAATDAVSTLSEKDILKALMSNLDVKLTDAAHCKGVGTDEHDQTIGDYLSGFWSFHTARQGNNWIAVSAAEASVGRQLVSVVIYRAQGEENWGWGVSFVMDSEQAVDRSSFTCLGAG